MSTIKEAALASIKGLPNGCTAEDLMYQIHLISQVFDGLKDAREGKTISTEEILQRVKKWDRK